MTPPPDIRAEFEKWAANNCIADKQALRWTLMGFQAALANIPLSAAVEVVEGAGYRILHKRGCKQPCTCGLSAEKERSNG